MEGIIYYSHEFRTWVIFIDGIEFETEYYHYKSEALRRKNELAEEYKVKRWVVHRKADTGI
jgi:hypothetical protein